MYTNKKVNNKKSNKISNDSIVSNNLLSTQLMQKKINTQQSIFGNNIIQRKNNTGIPDKLKNGMEQKTGINLDKVKVQYNSSVPATLQAHAFAKGNTIHIAQGQEKHLPHELGHVVQQAQGRVKPTKKVGNLAINDNQSLENEATKLGQQAMQMKSYANKQLKNISFDNVTQLAKWTWTANGWISEYGKLNQKNSPTFAPKGQMYINSIYDDETNEWALAEQEPLEQSDIKQLYNPAVACVLQSLQTMGIIGSASAFHNTIWSGTNEALSQFKSYDLDTVYPALYRHLHLVQMPNKLSLQDLVEVLDEGRYIVELAGVGSEGHNSVLCITQQGKKKTASLKDAQGNKSTYKIDNKTIPVSYWRR